MKKRTIVKLLLWSGASLFGLVLLLVLHIYLVTRPKVDASTRVMARIDMHQPITDAESVAITGWLYRQKGVDHVMCNPGTAIAVFTFSPMMANGNEIAARFRTTMHYPNSNRYMPTQNELRSGCPVASTSITYKIYSSIKHWLP